MPKNKHCMAVFTSQCGESSFFSFLHKSVKLHSFTWSSLTKKTNVSDQDFEEARTCLRETTRQIKYVTQLSLIDGFHRYLQFPDCPHPHNIHLSSGKLKLKHAAELEGVGGGGALMPQFLDSTT